MASHSKLFTATAARVATIAEMIAVRWGRIAAARRDLHRAHGRPRDGEERPG